MKYSQLPFRSRKGVSSEMTSKNARLLTQAGFIHQEIAGVYSFLPLGLRVLNKIEKIIREEMDKVSAELKMPSLASLSAWQKTGRLGTVDVLMKASGANSASLSRNSTEYVLNSTHEEVVTPLVQEWCTSYKSLPTSVYQIQTKFRNEPRAKSGLLRCREFSMKDAYSFHASEEDLKRYYEVVKQTYLTIFDRLGLGDDTVVALASGGDFTPDFSHEFQTICEAGEDTLFTAAKAGLVFNREVAPSQAPKIKNQSSKLEELQEIKAEGVIGVQALAKLLMIPESQTTKTILFETEQGLVAAVTRGTYEIHEEKLKKILGVKSLSFASAEAVMNSTGAKVGYAGPINLPKSVRVLFDDSLQGVTNFECGSNKTGYHCKNVNFGRDLPTPEKFYDFKVAQEGDLYPENGELYQVNKACEVGNIFPLNIKFSQAFDYTFTNSDGTQSPVYMGCYGIGPSRLVGVIVEKFADDKGLVWPIQVAPFRVYLVDIQSAEQGQKIYDLLTSLGVEVLWDDRDVRAGEKFADADLFGIPHRLVVSAKTGEKVEWKRRLESETQLIDVTELKRELFLN